MGRSAKECGRAASAVSTFTRRHRYRLRDGMLRFAAFAATKVARPSRVEVIIVALLRRFGSEKAGLTPRRNFRLPFSP
jgi:hypothetical protein